MDKDFLTVLRSISERLKQKGIMLSVAESCTGGAISNAITNLPGASLFFSCGVVSYSAEAKKAVLGISESLIKKHGVVSEETAAAMARAVARRSGTGASVAVTGNAGPGSLEGKEVGLIYIAAVVNDMVESKGLIIKGGRMTVKRRAALEALRFLDQALRVWL